jgi:hypothetical protein
MDRGVRHRHRRLVAAAVASPILAVSGIGRRLAPGLAALVLAGIVAACGSATPTSSGQTAVPSLSHYQGDDIAFDYPGTWNAASFPVMSSFSNVLVFLSTSALADPCDRTANSIACVRSAATSLEPGGVLVQWSRNGFPGWTFDRSRGKPLTVGGRSASIEDLEPAEPCQMIGGTRELVVTIPDPEANMNWTEARACIAGPVAGTETQVAGMLKTVAFLR